MAVGDLQAKNISVSFPAAGGAVRAVDGVSLDFAAGACTVIVGESGCGKSVLGQAILGILPDYVQTGGALLFGGQDILRRRAAEFYGRIMSIVPQNPGESMNPIRKIGRQMEDVYRAAGLEDRDDAKKTAALRSFGLTDTARVLAAYPHELSGGMQQRVLCAMSVLCGPVWILADEPTKGLDETTASAVYENLRHLKKDSGCSLIIITHDIGLAQSLGDTLAVMYAGQVLETGPQVLTKPLHPYTRAFLASLPENGFKPMRGQAPSPEAERCGCRFAPRCDCCSGRCLQEEPPGYDVGGTTVRCFLYAGG